MPKVIDPAVALVVSLGLSNLVVVVGEAQVHTARVDVDWGFFEYGGSHCRAFYVPAGTTWSPGRLPKRLIWFGLLPKSKVFLVSLLTCVSLGENAFAFSYESLVVF